MQPSQRTRAELLNEISMLERRVAEYEKLIQDQDSGTENHFLGEQTFRTIFQKSQDILLIVDTEDLSILELNPAVRQILGYEEKNLRGQSFHCLFPKHISGNTKLEMIQNYGNVFIQEFERKDGSSVTLDMTAALIPWQKESAILVTLRDASKRIQAEHEKDEAFQKLQDALDNIKTLRGLLPICSYCKKIRDDDGYWQRLETYMVNHSEAEFSHGICPECIKEHYPEYYDESDG